MQTIPVEIDHGLLRLPEQFVAPPHTRLAVLLLVDDDVGELAEKGGAFDFLRDEPDLYSDADILPGRINPAFGKRGSMIPETPVPGEFVTTHATSNTAAAR